MIASRREAIFVDTNVLVYAIDSATGERHRTARNWIDSLWRSQRGRVSLQVMQEFYNTITRKLRPGLSPAEAQKEVRAFLPWSPLEISTSILEQAWFYETRFQLSFGDALIVSSARAADCRFLLTEDLQDGQEFDGLKVLSPFRLGPDSV